LTPPVYPGDSFRSRRTARRRVPRSPPSPLFFCHAVKIVTALSVSTTFTAFTQHSPFLAPRPQGLTFINIPIRFDNPTEADFETFASVLSDLGSRKVLVHCQINLRASAFVFLYRAIVLKDDPSLAYEAVSKVWLPEGPWRRLIESQLHKHKVAFDLF
jgi:hypothetical protein